MGPIRYRGKARAFTLFILVVMVLMAIGVAQAADDMPPTQNDDPIFQPGDDEELETQAGSDIVGVIGDEDRNLPLDVNLGIVHILYDGSGTCTGFMISPRHVMTSGSCVLRDGVNRITSATIVTVAAGRDGLTEPYGEFPVSQDPGDIYIAPGWAAAGGAAGTAPSDDYAVLTLEAPLPSDTSVFELANTSVTTYPGVVNEDVKANPYTINGYPNSAQCGGSPCGGVQYQHSGIVNEYLDETQTEVDFGAPAGELRYRIDAAEQGQQGSPVFRQVGSELRVVGIHSRFSDTLFNQVQYNQGTAITTAMLTQLNSWGIPINGPDSTRIREIADGEEGSFIAAVQDANADPNEPWTILLDPDGSYTFDTLGANAVGSVTGDVTIVGRGATVTENRLNAIRFIQVDTGGKLTLTGDLTIVGFNSLTDQNGGGVQVLGNAQLTVLDTVFENNRAANGGAIAVGTGAQVVIASTRFTSNIAFQNGGGIYNNGGTINVIDDALFGDTITTATFGGNSAENTSGGAIRSEGAGDVQLSSVSFRGNTAGSSGIGGRGGAISNAGTSLLTVGNATIFRENAASLRGGAIDQVSTVQATVTDTIIVENEAGPRSADDTTNAGAGSAVYAGGPMTMRGVEVADNLTYRRTLDIAKDTNINGGAIEIAANFTMESSEDGVISNYVQRNQILLDFDLDNNKSNADVVSYGAAFVVSGGSNVKINETCINSNLSVDYQGVYNEIPGLVTVDATGNWWGNAEGPGTDGNTAAGDRVSGGVNFSGFVGPGLPVDEEGNPIPPDDCGASALPPTNDDMANAFVLQLLDDNAPFDNQNATVKPVPDDPEPTCGASNKTVWYTYDPLKSYDVSLLVNPYGSVENATPIVTVWRGDINDRANLVQISCDVGAADDPAVISNLPLEPLPENESYWIQVGTTGQNGGSSQINIDAERTDLVGPLSGTSLNTRQPTFVWTTVGYADSYALNLTDTNFGIDETLMIQSDDARCSADTCIYQWGVRLPDSDYSWNVTVTDESLGLLDPPRPTEYPSAFSLYQIISPETYNHIINGDFSEGTSGFNFSGNSTAQVVDGVLEFTGTQQGVAASAIQTTDYKPLPGTKFNLAVDIANPSALPKSFTLRLKDGGSTEAISCSFQSDPLAEFATYTVRGITATEWSSMNFELYVLGDSAPSLRVDNIDVRYEPTLDIVGTRCIEPASPNLIQNPTFDEGENFWTFQGDVERQIVGNSLQMRHTDPGSTATLLQTVDYDVEAQFPFEIQIDLGNTAGLPRDATVSLFQTGRADQITCSFSIPANSSLRTYRVRGITTTDWADLNFEVVSSGGNTDPYLLVDDIDLRYIPLLDVSSTECIDAPSDNLVSNPSFEQGADSWKFSGDIRYDVVDETLQAQRASIANVPVILQNIPFAPNSGLPFIVNVEMGNTTTAPKGVTVMISESGGQKLQCSFNVPGGSDLQTYTLRGITTSNWSDLSFKLFVGGDTDPHLLVDNVDVRFNPSLDVSSTECVGGLVSNPLFGEGVQNWSLFGDFTFQVVDNVLQLTGTNAQSAAAAVQNLPFQPEAESPMQASIELGNNSTVTKNVAIRMREVGSSNQIICYFNIPPNTALQTYTMRGVTEDDWANLSFELFVTGDSQPSLLVDEVFVEYLPSLDIEETECSEPTDVTPGQNVVTNSGFDTNIQGWKVFGDATAVVNNGALNLTGLSGNSIALVQTMTYAPAADTPIEMQLAMSNNSAVNKYVGVSLSDNARTSVLECSFVVPANSSLQTYTLRGKTGTAWAQTKFQLYLDSDAQPALLIDNVDVRNQPGIDPTSVECVTEANIAYDGAFNAQGDWLFYGNGVQFNVANGQLSWYGGTVGPAVALSLGTPYRPNAGTTLEMQVDIGNTSGVEKNVSMRLVDPTVNSELICYLRIPAGQAPTTYTLRGEIDADWTKMFVQLYVRGDNQPALTVDNADVRVLPGVSVGETLCTSLTLDNMMFNPTFDTDTSYWTGSGDFTAGLQDGVLKLTGTNPSQPMVLFQRRSPAPPNGTPMEASIQLGNTSAVDKNVSLVLKSTVGTPMTCNFKVPANTPLQTYTVRGRTDANWTNTQFQIYLAGDNQPSLLVDNVDVRYNPALNVSSGVVCLSPPGKNLLRNPNFDGNSTAFWSAGGQFAVGVVDGVLRFTGTDLDTFAPASIGSAIPTPYPSGTTFEVSVDLGNNSTARKSVTVLLLDPTSGGSTIQCSFSIPANTALRTYTMRGKTDADWTVFYYRLFLAADNQPALLMDNVSVRTSTSFNPSGTECITPTDAGTAFFPMAFSLDTVPEMVDAPTDTPATPTDTPDVGSVPAVSPPVAVTFDDGAPYWEATASWSLTEDAAYGGSGMGWQILATGDTEALMWQQPLDLTDALNPTLQFQSRQLVTEAVAVVQATPLDANEWSTLGVVAPSGDWTPVTISLDDYMGKTINLRFVWVGTEADLWQLDAVQVTGDSVDTPPDVPTLDVLPTIGVTDTPPEVVPTEEATDEVIAPTATPEPPTLTPEPPTATIEPPTATSEPPTATPVPPTVTPALFEDVSPGEVALTPVSVAPIEGAP